MPKEGKLPDLVLAMAPTIIEALDSAGIGLTITRQVGEDVERIYANESLGQILGRDPETVITPGAHIDPEDRERIAEMHRRTLAGEQIPMRLRATVIRPDGTRVPVEVGMAMTEWEGAGMTVAYVRDLTEVHQIEQALRASENRFRTLAEAAPDSITVAIQGRLVYANPATARLLRAETHESLIGRDLRSMVAEEELAPMRERLARVARGERLSPYTYHSRRDDGEPLILEISSAAVEWEGKPAILGYGRDVTERRRMEAELMQADRMITVGTLAAGVAHEINNPLTYILLHLQRLRRQLPERVSDGVERAEITRMLEEALEGGSRVRGIVRDLLAFSREAPAKQSPVDLRPVLESAIKIASTAHGRRVPIELSCDDELPPVSADEARLGQVFLNLLVNAVQAFGGEPPDDGSVRVRAQLREAAVEIAFEDNGPGIPPADLKRVMDPFFTTKPVGTGTGLGLPISRSIVETAGGTLTVGNRSGGGVAAVIRLPAHRAQAAGEQRPTHAPGKGEQLRGRALVIDGDPMVARAIADVLRESFAVTVARDGHRGLEELGRREYDLVLCDINMPPPGGIEIYGSVVEKQPAYRERFLFLTGGGQSQRTGEFVRTHRHRVIPKPFDIETLLNAARGVLEPD